MFKSHSRRGVAIHAFDIVCSKKCAVGQHRKNQESRDKYVTHSYTKMFLKANIKVDKLYIIEAIYLF